MIDLSNRGRIRLLTTASATVAAVAMASAAQAGTTTVASGGAPTVIDAEDIINQAAVESGDPILSDIPGAAVGVSGTATTGVTLVVDDNDVLARSIGNNIDNELDLSIIENDINGDGGAALISTINTADSMSTVNGVAVGLDLDEFTTGSLTVEDNTVRTEASGNVGTTTVAGPIPGGYVSDTAGSSTVTTGGAWLVASGSVLASTSQVNDATTVDAYAGGIADNAIGIVLEDAGDNSIAATPVIDGNTISAAARGNRSDSTIDLQAGDNPTFTGTAAVTNAQSNYSEFSPAPHAIGGTNENSTILADFSAAGAFTNTLTGGVTVTGNTIASSASGNEALGVDGVAGNRILLGDGLSFVGLATGPATTSIVYDSVSLTQSATADVIINNSQGNVGAGNDTASERLDVNGHTFASTIGADLEAVDGASVDVSGNASTATASGNAASSAFEAGETINSFSGSLAVANQQSNVYVDVEASNQESLIGGEVVDAGQAELPDSGVTVNDNRVAATAYGNQSSQGITLAASTTTLPATAVELRGGVSPDGNLSAEGGATAANLQSVYSSSVSALQDFSAVGVTTGATTVSNSELAVSGNTQEGASTGNSATTNVALSGTTVTGAVGAVNTQIVADDFRVNSESRDSVAGAEVLNVDDGTIDVTANRQAATTYGNQVNQTVSVDANTIALAATGAALEGGADPIPNGPVDSNVVVNANVGVASLQAIDGNDVDQELSATLTGSTIGITADGNVSGSTLSVTWSPEPDPEDPDAPLPVRNVQEAVAVGSSGTNGLSLAGNDVGTGAGVASVQLVDGVSILASSSGNTIVASALDVDDSTIAVSNNLQRAIAYGGSVGNSLEVAATNVVVDDAIGAAGPASVVTYNPDDVNGFVLDGDEASNPTVDAAYGVLNVQTVHANVTSLLTGTDAVGIDVEEVSDSTLINDGNAFVAAAYGAEARNAGSLGSDDHLANVVTDATSSFASVLNVTNVQTMVTNENYQSNVSATASANGVDDTDVVHTLIEGDVENSSVSTSGNAIQAQAFGNLADNDVAARLNNIDTEDDTVFGGAGSATVEDVGGTTEAITDASFTLNNVQSATGAIGASLRDDGDPTGSATVRTEVTGSVIDSTIHTDLNSLTAASTANRADNLIDLAGNELATSTALTNYQIDPTSVTATIGVDGSEGTEGTDDAPFDFTYELNVAYSCNEGCELDSAEDRVLLTDLEGDEQDYLEDHGWSVAGMYLTRPTTQSVDATAPDSDYYDALDGQEYEGEGIIDGIPGTPGTPNGGGVIVAIGGDIDILDPSTVTVNRNTTLGSVTGNSATNAISVDANHLPDGTDHFGTIVSTSGLDTVAAGDHSLTNVQVVTGDVDDTGLESSVYGSFGIDMFDDELVLDSTLEVDGNNQSARAVANTADNSVTLTAGNTEAGAALASNQASSAPVTAMSDLDLFAPVASQNSTVSISGNGNLAVGVINNVTNSVTVAATNASYVTVPNQAVLDVDDSGPTDAFAIGTHQLLNKQVATTGVSATAVTSIFNDDFEDLASEGVNAGTVNFTNNVTTAEASANRAVNAMDINGSATLSASAGLINFQDNSATANASATTTAGVSLAGDGTPISAINGSTATLGANTTTALARGNAASNALNFAAGSNYGPTSVGTASASLNATPGSQDAAVFGRAAVLNVQNNTGAIEANSTDASYVMALNSVGTPTVTGATIGVIGNSVAAAAYGNTSNNSITVAALNTAMPTAVLGNQQTNTAGVTARAQQVTIGVTSGVGGIVGSSVRVSGNSITATAVGNNAVNTIVAH